MGQKGRPQEPNALTKLKKKSHLTKVELAQRSKGEIYASSGTIEPPAAVKGAARAMFRREAEYMSRVNDAAGVNIYGDTDIEALALMVNSYVSMVEYAKEEQQASKLIERQRLNTMKNKEALMYERYLRLLKLDPSSRVRFSDLNKSDEEAQIMEDI